MKIDWFTVLLFFFFIVLPLLQHIAQKRRPPAGEGQPEEWAARQDDVPQRESATGQEWDPWVEPEAIENARTVPNAWEELGLDDLFRESRPEPRPEPRPELGSEPRPARGTEPAPPPHPAPAPRPARSPTTWDTWREEKVPAPRPERVPAQPWVEAPIRSSAAREDRGAEQPRGPRKYVLSTPAAVAFRRSSEAGRILRDPRSVRQAIILSEILGPPRALRGREEER